MFHRNVLIKRAFSCFSLIKYISQLGKDDNKNSVLNQYKIYLRPCIKILNGIIFQLF